MKYHLQINSLADLPQAAQELLASIKDHKLIAFYGKMGAGKTTFIKAICAQAGVQEVVNSPTFAIINQYEAKDFEQIYHFDFYRLETYQEALDIGVFDYWDSGDLCLMEWPEKVEKLLPKDCVYLSITENELNGTRTIAWEV
ncbi:MAG: tRNA (adenosine(37)-N6)-threonylcarbamoyltransferase complex ATPase subunit type 1 TsaE [Bacteroidetes bacterium 4572_77]|nr:MAG: tRNA (adenosine(37)-N6)-threonylcarbamoyltransferase complex ATPase subunit type 1 TsaE [Bacteroidetes bacterium 4572_77]